ncbi:MAG: hypothetical protein RLZZ182_1347 [Pseudomonadota bacterium]
MAGVVHEGVHGFLNPASEALAEAGFRQTLVFLDHPRHHHLVAQLPARVDVCLVPFQENHRLRRWLWLGELTQSLLRNQTIDVVHVHGFLPWALGLRFGSLLPDHTQVFYTPHGSRSLAWIERLQSVSGSLLAPAQSRLPAIIAPPGPEARKALLHHAQPVFEIDAALPDLLFAMPRREARRPLLVAGDWNLHQAGMERYCQMAVLLSAQELNVSFNWIGHLTPWVRTRLQASNVGAHSLTADTDLWQRLAPAWCHVAPHAPHGFPMVTATAMALGLPTVAIDCAEHQQLIEHGRNGFLFRNMNEALTLLSQLIDQPALRERIGQEARQRAAMRWSRQAQQHALLRTYSRG